MTRRLRFSPVVLATLVALTACGGGGGTGLPSAPQQGKAASLASAALTFFIARPSTAGAHAKRPSYLPSATQSIVVNVYNADGTPTNPPTAASVLNVSSSGCTSVSGGQQCTVMVTVPFGSLLFAIAAYAQPNGSGALLSSSTASVTVGSGPNNVPVTLNAQAQYVGTNLDGGGVQSVMIDHQAGTFQVSKPGLGVTSSGTYTTLPNGDLKGIITAATDSTTIGSIAYIRELANGALMFVATDSTTPNADGSSTNADFGAMTSVQPCPTSSESLSINAITIAGSAFPSQVSTHEAYAVGTGSVANGTLTFSGTSYSIAGSNLGATNASPGTCSNGVFTDPNAGTVVFDAQGFLVVASGPNQGQTSSQNGNFGFRAPSQPYNLATIASQSYEAYSGQFLPVNGTFVKAESPGTLTPAGANALKACPYVNFEANSVATTNCTTLTFTAQPFPGLITGTAVNSQLNATFVAAVGQINGKYMLVVLSADSSASQAVNLIFMQQ
jgi:hypothetical protein